VLKRWTLFLTFLAFIGLVIFAADNGLARSFFSWVQSFPLGDKAGHFVLMGGLAFLLNRALQQRLLWPCVQLGSMLVALFVVTEEISQIWIPGRTFDLWDLVADFIGISIADWRSRS